MDCRQIFPDGRLDVLKGLLFRRPLRPAAGQSGAAHAIALLGPLQHHSVFHDHPAYSIARRTCVGRGPGSRTRASGAVQGTHCQTPTSGARYSITILRARPDDQFDAHPTVWEWQEGSEDMRRGQVLHFLPSATTARTRCTRAAGFLRVISFWRVVNVF
jgi:hypothetical protein